MNRCSNCWPSSCPPTSIPIVSTVPTVPTFFTIQVVLAASVVNAADAEEFDDFADPPDLPSDNDFLDEADLFDDEFNDPDFDRTSPIRGWLNLCSQGFIHLILGLPAKSADNTAASACNTLLPVTQAVSLYENKCQATGNHVTAGAKKAMRGLGPEHPSTLNTIYNLCNFYKIKTR